MNTRADFYILQHGSLDAKWLLSCQIAEKALKNGLKTFIQTSNSADAQHLDDLLWSFRDTSFVPHALIGSDNSPAPILIGEKADTHRFDALINVSDKAIDNASEYSRIFEIVANDASSQQLARDRFKTYRGHEFELHTHKIGGE